MPRGKTVALRPADDLHQVVGGTWSAVDIPQEGRELYGQGRQRHEDRLYAMASHPEQGCDCRQRDAGYAYGAHPEQPAAHRTSAPEAEPLGPKGEVYLPIEAVDGQGRGG